MSLACEEQVEVKRKGGAVKCCQKKIRIKFIIWETEMNNVPLACL